MVISIEYQLSPAPRGGVLPTLLSSACKNGFSVEKQLSYQTHL